MKTKTILKIATGLIFSLNAFASRHEVTATNLLLNYKVLNSNPFRAMNRLTDYRQYKFQTGNDQTRLMIYGHITFQQDMACTEVILDIVQKNTTEKPSVSLYVTRDFIPDYCQDYIKSILKKEKTHLIYSKKVLTDWENFSENHSETLNLTSLLSHLNDSKVGISREFKAFKNQSDRIKSVSLVEKKAWFSKNKKLLIKLVGHKKNNNIGQLTITGHEQRSDGPFYPITFWSYKIETKLTQ